ncbi:Coiled-coil domain-containing protein 170 [Microtus ochrogaster]|uniref:Coiled-coil domain-containing protein 170 n=1 Tax=Microtus ochrogaster TaxID=79684 RepID=A0A8J6H365_MICOH|nr:Coiled-coil domain-containing protein 170 [Microtus ochrogaster]
MYGDPAGPALSPPPLSAMAGAYAETTFPFRIPAGAMAFTSLPPTMNRFQFLRGRAPDGTTHVVRGAFRGNTVTAPASRSQPRSMAMSLQSVSHSDPGRLANSQTKETCETEPSETGHLSHLSAQANVSGAHFDPPLEAAPTRNPITYNNKATDPVHPDLTSLLVKNKTLLAELRNLQSKLFIKETSLQEVKRELESYKESNAQQLLQIMSLRDDIRNLQNLIASLMKIKILKNTNSQNLGRSNWDLTEEHLVDREKVGQHAELEKRWPCSSRFSSCMHLKGPEDSLDIFPVKDNGEASDFERDIAYSEGPSDGQNIVGKYQQDLLHKEKLASEFDRPPYSCSWEATPEQAHHQDFLGQLATLLSDSIGPILATEEAVKERIQEMGANEQLWKSKTEALRQETQMLTERLEQLYHLYGEVAARLPQTEGSYTGQKRPLQHLEGQAAVNYSLRSFDTCRKKENSRTRTAQTDKHRKFKQLEMLLDNGQNWKTAAAPRMEEKIQRLQKQLTDLKLSNKNIKTQLTRINILKDKTIERLRQSVTKVEAVKDKTAVKTDNLKTAPDSAAQAVRAEKERVRQVPAPGPPEPSTTIRNALKGVSGREQELADFRETIMKMLGLNMKTADKEAINQLKLVIQVYEISNKNTEWSPKPGPPSCTEFALRGRPNLRFYSPQQFSKGGYLHRARAGPCCACAHSKRHAANQAAGVVPERGRGGAGAGLLFWEVCWSLQPQAGDFSAVRRVGAGGGWGDILLSLNGSARLGSGS